MAAVEKKYVDKVPQNEVRQWKKRHTKKLRKLRITSRQKLEEKGVHVTTSGEQQLFHIGEYGQEETDETEETEETK